MLEVTTYQILAIVIGLWIGSSIDLEINNNRGFAVQQARTEEQLEAKGMPDPKTLSRILRIINEGQ